MFGVLVFFFTSTDVRATPFAVLCNLKVSYRAALYCKDVLHHSLNGIACKLFHGHLCYSYEWIYAFGAPRNRSPVVVTLDRHTNELQVHFWGLSIPYRFSLCLVGSASHPDTAMLCMRTLVRVMSTSSVVLCNLQVSYRAALSY